MLNILNEYTCDQIIPFSFEILAINIDTTKMCTTTLIYLSLVVSALLHTLNVCISAGIKT